MNLVERPYVLNVGSIKIDHRAFAERGFELLHVSPTKVRAAADRSRAIIIAEPPGRVGVIRDRLERLKATADAYDLAFGILVNAKEVVRVQRVVAEVGVAQRSRVRPITELGHMAEFTRRDPGPPVGKVRIFPERGIRREVKHLLKRSFYDCDRIYLKSLSGGRAALNVFSVHAWLVQHRSEVGPRPLPFFFKIGESTGIEKERANYREYADLFIPFHLRPNILPDRCVAAGDLSSIVGNFVDGSLPLREVLRSGQSPGIIFSLFENTLKGFRAQPSDNSFGVTLADFVKARAEASKIPANVIALAQSLGLKTSALEVEATLIERTRNVNRPICAYHGDLHPGNVMARGRDAIVIDFSAVRQGPITADPATLEVGLVFGTDRQDELKHFEEWKNLVDELYASVPIHKPPLPERHPGPFSWLRRAVSDIRHILLGCDCEQREAAAVLATFLLRFARLDVAISGTGVHNALIRKHAYALVVAERLTSRIPPGEHGDK